MHSTSLFDFQNRKDGKDEVPRCRGALLVNPPIRIGGPLLQRTILRLVSTLVVLIWGEGLLESTIKIISEAPGRLGDIEVILLCAM